MPSFGESSTFNDTFICKLESVHILLIQCFGLASLITISINISLIILWVTEIRRKSDLPLSWLLTFLKLLADTFVVLVVLLVAAPMMVFFARFERSCDDQLKNPVYILFLVIFQFTPTCVSFTLKLNLFLNLERYMMLRYPLNFQRYFSNSIVCTVSLLALLVQISTFALLFNFEVDVNMKKYRIDDKISIVLYVVDILVIFGGFFLNLCALLQLRYNSKPLKKFRTLIFLFCTSVICCLTILPLDVVYLVENFTKTNTVDDRLEYVIFLLCIFGQSVVYPIASDFYLVSTNPLLKTTIFRRIYDFKEKIRLYCKQSK